MLALTLAAACATTGGRAPGDEPETQRPLTRAERTGYMETSRHADVVLFIDSLRLLGAPIHAGSIGRTHEGREIPYVVASRPLVRTAAEARALERPIVYVQGNIHGGEVEGKEALQALLRDLVFDRAPNVLDSIVLIAVPIYNADGNERFGPQERNRGSQNGPALIGQRANAQGFDLNRDYVKADAPETRASLAMFNEWDPHVFVDLHTTNGSYHGYALTYAPSLHPAALTVGPYTRDTLLPAVRARVRERHGFETFDYGNFPGQASPPRAWTTYDHRPRFGTNYYGLRGRIGILSEAYSHDPFERRVAATRAFVTEILSYVAEQAPQVVDLARRGDRALTQWTAAGPRQFWPNVPLRSRVTTQPHMGPVLVEDIEQTGDTVRTEVGLRPGLRRTGRFRAVEMAIHDRFEPVLERRIPFAYVLHPDAVDMLAPRLALHGVVVERTAAETRVRAEAFTVDSIARAARPFQGHQEVTLFGRWNLVMRMLPAGSHVIRPYMRRGVLEMILLEPESDDGFATWNVLEPLLAAGREYPVLRLPDAAGAPIRFGRD